MCGNPGVETRSKPGEPGSNEQRADRTPYRVTGTQGRGNRGVTAGNPATITNPLHGGSTLVLGEAELVEVQ